MAFGCRLQNQVDEVVDVMQNNIGRVMERGERLEDLRDKSGEWTLTDAWFPPVRCRSAVAVSPFCCAVVPLPFFRSVAHENGIAGNVFPYTWG